MFAEGAVELEIEVCVADVFEAAGTRSVLLVTHRSEGLGLVDRVVALPAG